MQGEHDHIPIIICGMDYKSHLSTHTVL